MKNMTAVQLKELEDLNEQWLLSQDILEKDESITVSIKVKAKPLSIEIEKEDKQRQRRLTGKDLDRALATVPAERSWRVSGRAKRVIKGFPTIGSVARWAASERPSACGCGPKTLQEIKDMLQDNGIFLDPLLRVGNIERKVLLDFPLSTILSWHGGYHISYQAMMYRRWPTLGDMLTEVVSTKVADIAEYLQDANSGLDSSIAISMANWAKQTLDGYRMS